MIGKLLGKAFGMPPEVADEIMTNPANAVFMMFERDLDPEKNEKMQLQEGEAQLMNCLFRNEGQPMVLIAAINSNFEIVRKIKLYDLSKALKPGK
jgi:hypothetical protein